LDDRTELLAYATAWLSGEGRFARDAGALLEGLSAALIELGLPLDRATFHAPTLHPSHRWVMRVWLPGVETRTLLRPHGIEGTPTFHGNTVEHVVATGRPYRMRLDEGGSLDFPVLDELRDTGLTDYLIVPLPAGSGRTGAASWATARPTGFTASEIAALTPLAGPLSLVFELKAQEGMLADVLAAYVGRDPARRILAGGVRRGDTRRMRAAMLLADMRGFGALSDATTPERVVAVLNRVFDAVVPAIEDAGGEVLKYIGDGVLAVFDTAGDEARARHAALRSARIALTAVAEAGDLPAIGIALHVGTVAYGNIGAGDRLDFTAIGRDVNVLARVEALCKVYGQPLLATGAFADGLSPALTPIDTVTLRGFNERQTLFALGDD
jgi:adenylate cyclase